MPFALGNSFRVTQGFHGTYSHSGSEEFAIDWKMPAGTPIHAARDGIVVKVKDDSDRGGPYREYEAAANYILIKHSDGTLANYAHLQFNGSAVRMGQRVRAGELIGFSGNTGFSTGAHLHFCVFRTRVGSERESLPIRFVNEQGDAIVLAEGNTYKSALPGESFVGATSPKDDSIWNRLPMFRGAQGGSRKAR
jgi:murein DD-endopeptidase MepM/ murein hydrolase activator NlpD